MSTQAMSTQAMTRSPDVSTDIGDDIVPAAKRSGPPFWRRVVDTVIAMRMEDARRYIERHHITGSLRAGDDIESQRHKIPCAARIALRAGAQP